MKKFFCTFLLVTCMVTLVTAQTVIDRPAFSLSYPSGWKIDTADPDYDPDALFSIDADENNLAMFILMDIAVDHDQMLDAQLESFKKLVMKSPKSVTPFTKWGSFTGNGMELKGKILGVFNGSVRLFVCTVKEKTMLVVMQCFDEDFPKLKEGFELIESSFRLKEVK